ncbi:SDR family NAD(P)-dependent oxidoreductase [Streptomonospora sp. PA3]|uniref:SDR family NAD(P)-dependent oxidoreductase n=1 Tax=Streptomonospora sp. PA3 TaxID=2607326 RepID=UPI0012DDD229|nr:SDR family NAD(P)-dependent oxidoreductase [Streptomonospora sp. PA3]MUL41424.1 SDR family NAD(P)-dependent oxidoreductase [Streptomonospora sp. PA3]
MTTQHTAQRPIGSGFSARTTAKEVLEGIDLGGRLAVVTGGYSGLGLETTRALAEAGAHVVVPARRPEAAEEAAAAFAAQAAGGVEVDELDLADLDSVRAFADRFLASGRSIDIMIGNAGIMACPETRVGPGWEAQFATNHLGHFALVNRLWPAIADGAGARVVSVSSRGHHRSPIRWDDIHFERGYDKWEAYGQAKTANVLFAVHLDALGGDQGVRAFSLHPGGILTPLQRHLPKEEMIAAGWIDEQGRQINPRFKTPEQGAATQVWAATSPQLTGMGGVYCEDCDIAEPVETGDASTLSGVRTYAIDPDEAARLWRLSAELTGVDAFAR